MARRPVSITIVALLLVAAGAVGFVYHFRELNLQRPFQDDTLWVEVVRILAIVAGVFLWRGRNWARWLTVAWIAFHVVVSAFHSAQEAIMHLVLLVVFAYVLFRPAANAFFLPANGSR